LADSSARKKRTITEIRDAKTSGKKVIYMSVPDYTSVQWGEMAGIDVAVIGTDGQILLGYDLLSMLTGLTPKFTIRHDKLTEVAVGGIKQYVN